MIKEHYSPKLYVDYVNPMKIALTREELQFVRDNCFYNLKIDKLDKDTIASVYDAIVALMDFYELIDAQELHDYAKDIADRLFDYVPWEEIEKEQNANDRLAQESLNYVPETTF